MFAVEMQNGLLLGIMGLGMQELVIIGIVAVLLFGKKLPDVAKSLGNSYREFRRGLSDMQSSVESATSMSDSPRSSTPYDDYDDLDEPTAPKFEPPPSEPQESDTAGEV